MTKPSSSLDLAIPKGSWVLVTGATGYIASHIVNEFLISGYKVRGTARSSEKAERTRKLYSKYGDYNYECTIVPDMAADGAFDEAVKGVSAFVHTASVLTFDNDPSKVIPQTIAGTVAALKAAAKEKTVKRFVYTSSSTAASAPKPNKKFHIDSNTWNEEDVRDAWAPPPYENGREWVVYAASKTESEKAIWKFVREEKPGFVVNCVLPDTNLGRILAKEQRPSSGSFALSLYTGEGLDGLKVFPPREQTLRWN